MIVSPGSLLSISMMLLYVVFVSLTFSTPCPDADKQNKKKKDRVNSLTLFIIIKLLTVAR
jgi:hypothetical protein